MEMLPLEGTRDVLEAGAPNYYLPRTNWKTPSELPGYLFYSLATIFVLPLRPGGDDDPLGQPVIGAPLTFFFFGFADAQPVLKLFDQAVLGDGFMEENRAQLAPRREIAAHGMHVGDLLGFPDDGFDLKGGEENVEVE